MSKFKIPLKSDKFNDPSKAALDLQDSQLDRITIRDGVEKISKDLEGQILVQGEDIIKLFKQELQQTREILYNGLEGLAKELADLEDVVANSITQDDIDDAIDDLSQELGFRIAQLNDKINDLHDVEPRNLNWFQKIIRFLIG